MGFFWRDRRRGQDALRRFADAVAGAESLRAGEGGEGEGRADVIQDPRRCAAFAFCLVRFFVREPLEDAALLA